MDAGDPAEIVDDRQAGRRNEGCKRYPLSVIRISPESNWARKSIETFLGFQHTALHCVVIENNLKADGLARALRLVSSSRTTAKI